MSEETQLCIFAKAKERYSVICILNYIISSLAFLVVAVVCGLTSNPEILFFSSGCFLALVSIRNPKPRKFDDDDSSIAAYDVAYLLIKIRTKITILIAMLLMMLAAAPK